MTPTLPANYFVSAEAAQREMDDWASSQHTRTYEIDGESITIDLVDPPSPTRCPFDGGVLVFAEFKLYGPPRFVHLHGAEHSNGMEFLQVGEPGSTD